MDISYSEEINQLFFREFKICVKKKKNNLSLLLITTVPTAGMCKQEFS